MCTIGYWNKLEHGFVLQKWFHSQVVFYSKVPTVPTSKFWQIAIRSEQRNASFDTAMLRSSKNKRVLLVIKRGLLENPPFIDDFPIGTDFLWTIFSGSSPDSFSLRFPWCRWCRVAIISSQERRFILRHHGSLRWVQIILHPQSRHNWCSWL